MITQELLDYIRIQRERGVADAEIQSTLTSHGWSAEDIAAALQGEPASQAPTALTKPRSTTKTTRVIIGSVVGGLLVVGTAAAGYYGYQQWARPKLTPTEVLAKARENLSTIKSGSYTLEIKSDVKGALPLPSTAPYDPGAPQNARFALSLSGLTDVLNPNAAKSQSTLSLEANVSPTQTLSGSFEIRKTPEALFAKLHNLRIPPLFTLTTDWVNIDVEELQKTILEGYGGYQQDFMEGLWKGMEITPEDRASIEEILRNASLIAVGQELPEETINGQVMYHYAWAPDRVGIKKLVLDIVKVVEKKVPDVSEIEEFTKEFDEGFEKIKIMMPSGELWIGKKDLFLHRGTLMWSGEDPSIAKDVNVTINATLSIADHNKSLSVETPSPVKSLDQVMTEFLGPEWKQSLEIYKKQNVKPAEDANQDTDGDGLNDAEELRLSSDPSNPDTDGDGYNDGEEVRKGFSPTIKGQ